MKKNLFVYLGTRNPDSRTYRYTTQIIDLFKKKANTDLGLDIEVAFYTPLNSILLPSTGCCNCFSYGKCPNEKNPDDQGDEIKKQLEKADIVLFASPVYSHNVSSDMKILIDRISHWGHIFKLVNKSAFVITTSESNGSTFVADYLEKTFRFMGATIACTTNFINSEDFLADDYIEETVEKLLFVCRPGYKFDFTNGQETTFQTLKLILKDYPENHFEYQYWKESGLFESDSLTDYMKLKLEQRTYG